MKCFVAVLTTGVGFGLFATPIVSDVTMKEDAESKAVSISYRVGGEPAIVTVDIQTNAGNDVWASIGAAHLTTLAGDVHRRVPVTPADEMNRVSWTPAKDWPNREVSFADTGKIRAVVTAWATNAPPDYMVVDLREPYGVTYYPSAELLPEGPVTNKAYKDYLLVMRKIPAAGIIWRMGLQAGAYNFTTNKNESTHKVKLSHDYYMGVYPLTQRQYRRVLNTNSHPLSDLDGDRAPMRSAQTMENVQAKPANMRGSSDGMKWPTFNSDGSLDWETSSKVDSTSVLGKMRMRYAADGVRFDFPTEAQWEFACRGGRGTLLYSGEAWTADNAYKLGRFSENADQPDCEGGSGKNVAVVGSFLPNGWGLYDMVGNVMERCLDVYEDFGDSIERAAPVCGKVYVDPVGAARDSSITTNVRMYRGCYYDGSWLLGRSSARTFKYAELDAYWNTGYRLCWTLR